MQLELIFSPPRRQTRDRNSTWLTVGAREIQLCFVRHLRARRYVLRLRRDGSARVTIPRGGSIAQARQFAEKSVPWLEKQLLRQTARPVRDEPWREGTQVLFRGVAIPLRVGLEKGVTVARLDNEVIPIADPTADLRPPVERYLFRLAQRELTLLAHELATLHGFRVQRVTVRNQRSRWGSCSARGTISLNWRLVQTPCFVRDYILLHELAHLKEMNHSRRFWREVERLCPGFLLAEQWLKKHSKAVL